MVFDLIVDKVVCELLANHFLGGICLRFLSFASDLSFGIKCHLGIDSKWLLAIRIIRLCWGQWGVGSGASGKPKTT